MSLPRLLVVAFALSSFSVAFAEDQTRQPENSSPIFIKPYSGARLLESQTSHSLQFLVQCTLVGNRVAIPTSDATCYTMRTYVVDPNFDKQIVIQTGPDEVSYNPPVRDDSPLTGTYTTCQPSSQFAVKMTVQPVLNGNDQMIGRPLVTVVICSHRDF